MTGERPSILITGASSGIGRATAVALAAQGASLMLAGRSEVWHAEVLAEVRASGAEARFLSLDLGDMASVRQCAARILDLGEPLHVLVNNAGLASSSGLTADGFERTFGVNHLGHFLLTELLLPRLMDSAPARIVNLASDAHFTASHIDWEALHRPTKSLTGLKEYAVSKLCNVLHARELAERLDGKGVNTYAVHPGVIASNIWRRVPWGLRQAITLLMQSPSTGAATTVHCATSEAVAGENGLYYDRCQPKTPSRLARDDALVQGLRRRSLEWTGVRPATS